MEHSFEWSGGSGPRGAPQATGFVKVGAPLVIAACLAQVGELASCEVIEAAADVAVRVGWRTIRSADRVLVLRELVDVEREGDMRTGQLPDRDIGGG
jgi:hypothetical protein